MSSALVLGKFLPPHRGHRLVVDAARADGHEVIITCLSKSQEPIAGELRSAWLRELFPDASVRHRVCDHDEDFLDDATWTYWIGQVRELVPEGVDAVYGSEPYTGELARRLHATPILVDVERMAVPVSSTAVRRDPLASWPFLEGPVREHYAVRVVVVGAESTGTTTLARDLAGALDTVWVPEYGREYSETKFDRGDLVWAEEEFIAIASEQQRREDAACRKCSGILVCDTDAFATALWHEYYMGSWSEAVAAVSASRKPDLYLLTGDEIPFEQDGYREGGPARHAMHERFVELLPARGVPWEVLRGSPRVRVKRALDLLGTTTSARRRSDAEATRWTTPPQTARSVADAGRVGDR